MKSETTNSTLQENTYNRFFKSLGFKTIGEYDHGFTAHLEIKNGTSLFIRGVDNVLHAKAENNGLERYIADSHRYRTLEDVLFFLSRSVVLEGNFPELHQKILQRLAG
ncbi:hypothetical protein [Aequorivita echinoideorum]|uniref:GSKIP domain-containing protein n=1 Tax=Aequorivita echinoideorum TaxID=1549647 RepID=A0ABS5S366_9FLAO|nr:hypothetical protein [Aequorivita echinoideorum]MBT0607658.1 hypothetical protein [Aequorivita echinoideorum]